MSGGTSAAVDAPGAGGVTLGGCRVRAGTSSWADRSLVSGGGFYPSRSLTAAERLAYYAHRLPLAEIATTYRFPPTPEVSKRWATITPEGFAFDLRAWSLLTGAPTWPESLWPDLHKYVRPPKRETSKLYRSHLPAGVVDECWERFCHSVQPLKGSGRLGVVIARFPSWFTPRPEAWEELAGLATRLEGFDVAVELSSGRWFEGDACEQTLALLEGIGLALVVQVEPKGPQPVVAATAEVAVVRFRGRAWADWDGAASASLGPGAVGPGSAVEIPAADPGAGGQEEAAWWSYRYSQGELSAWVPHVRDLASCTREVHLIMDNCWRTDAVDNAETLLELVSRPQP